MRNLESEPIYVHPEHILGSAANIYQGYKIAREKAGRRLVDTAATTGYVVMTSSLMGEVPRKQTISHLYLLEDVLERQNCWGDEINGKSCDVSVYWQRPHYAEEYAGILTSIHQDLASEYGQADGYRRADNIAQTLERWFKVNTLVEGSLAGKLDPGELNEEEKLILDRMVQFKGQEKAKAYRELVDEKWLDVILITTTDGDIEKAEKVKKPIFSATLLFQLSEDYANVRRDRRVNKLTLMSENGDYTRSRRVNELIELIKLSDPYVRGLGLDGTLGILTKMIVTGKSLVSRAESHVRGDNHWRKKEFFDSCDEFEQNVEEFLYNSIQENHGF